MASISECQNIWGRGLVNGQDPNYTTQEDLQDGGDPYQGDLDPDDPGDPDSDGYGDPDSPPQNSDCGPMTTYTFHTMLASLSLNDTPLRYKPPVGPWIRFTATYNHIPLRGNF
jgi:hypothetical protein